MKLVVDTNTLISGSLWQGLPARLLSAALAGQARLFVTGDNDLLTLESFGGIPIIKAAEALKLLGLT